MKRISIILVLILVLSTQGLAQPQESEVDPGVLPGNPFYTVSNRDLQ